MASQSQLSGSNSVKSMVKGPIPFSNAMSGKNNSKDLAQVRETQNSTVLEEDDSDLTDTLMTEISNSPR